MRTAVTYEESLASESSQVSILRILLVLFEIEILRPQHTARHWFFSCSVFTFAGFQSWIGAALSSSNSVEAT